MHIRIVFCLVGSMNVNYVCMSESHGSELLLVFFKSSAMYINHVVLVFVKTHLVISRKPSYGSYVCMANRL